MGQNLLKIIWIKFFFFFLLRVELDITSLSKCANERNVYTVLTLKVGGGSFFSFFKTFILINIRFEMFKNNINCNNAVDKSLLISNIKT